MPRLGRQGTYAGMRNAVEASLRGDLEYGRLELFWLAGQRGKPSLNADIQNAAEATRMIVDPDFEVLGTNMTSALSTFNAEGGITLTTAGADADQAILVPHLDANQSAWTQWTWGTDQQVRWSCGFATEGSIANCIIWAGLKLSNVPVTATNAHQAFFRYEDDNNNGDWEAINSIAGLDDAHDTNIAAAINTDYVFNIDIDRSRVARFYLNGTLVETSAPLTTGIDLIPYIGVMADGAAAAKAITLHWQRISRVYA